MNKEFYISLITRKLSKELDASQLKDLSSWLNTSKDNSALMDDFKSVWNLSGQYKQGMSVNTDAAFQNFTRTYDIPKAEPSVLEALAKKKLSFSIKLPILILFVISLITLIYFSGIFASQRITNDNMHVMTMQLDEFSSLTLAPESGYMLGASSMLSDNQKQDYEKLFTILEDKKHENLINSSSQLYSPVASLFEPAEKNYIIEDFSGQGFFELKSINESQAFLGLSDNVSVGTRNAAFNLQNYTDENIVTIDVQKGFLVLYDGQNNAYIIKAGERAVFNKNNKTLSQADKPKLNPYKWHKGILVFDNTTLEDVFKNIERFYGVDVELTDNSSMENINFTATLSMSNNLNDCLDLLHESIEMTIRRKGLRKIEVSDIKSN